MPMRSRYLLGTRGSALARWQAEHVCAALRARQPGAAWEVVTIVSRADREPDAPLAALAGEGIFVKELEAALERGDIDLAVHSMKDVPLDGSPKPLMLAAMLQRETPYDALVSRNAATLAKLPSKARIGTSSARRQSQLLHLRPDLDVVPMRGNVDTRLRKLDTESLDAVVLAAAGLIRLGYRARISELLEQFVPEPGQGAITVQVRREDRGLREIVSALDHAPTRVAVTAERACLAALGGGCRVPIGALATLAHDALHMHGVVASPDGRQLVRAEVQGQATDAEQLGQQLAKQLSALGARDILGSVSQ